MNKLQPTGRVHHYLEDELHSLLQHDRLIFEFFQSLLVDGLWYWDITNPEEEWMSPAFWWTFGYDHEFKAHKATEWQNIIFAEDLVSTKKALNLHLQNPNIPYDQTLRYHHKNGDTVWIRSRGVALYDDNGTPTRMLGCHINVTDIMRHQNASYRLKVKNEHLERQFNELKHKSFQEREMQDGLQQQLLLNRIRDDNGFCGELFFLEQVKLLIILAKRLKISITVVSVIQDSRRNTITEQQEINQFIRQKILPLIPEAPVFRFDVKLVGLIAVGLDYTELNTLKESSTDALTHFMWLVGRPSIAIRYSTFDNLEDISVDELDIEGLRRIFALTD
ncbi:PAS domain-containing protein [Salinimonas iocasae]|uniref:histidine kinase n=1 Tax=Salinimonas iocasae TaxID=2572577 RepID=A0A5B7YJZ4_9ALTE|nr:PAS domain-containing protein [Salinimonas iocasae]QCZ95029.1 PAS domain-containing protein [Salinimonas iocasae]